MLNQHKRYKWDTIVIYSHFQIKKALKLNIALFRSNHPKGWHEEPLGFLGDEIPSTDDILEELIVVLKNMPRGKYSEWEK